MESLGQEVKNPVVSGHVDAELDSYRVVDGRGLAVRRRTFLAYAGAAMVTFGMKLGLPSTGAAALPSACYGFRQCACCNGGECCEGGCTMAYLGCYTGNPCWVGCASNHNRYWCCDNSSVNRTSCICAVLSCSNCC